MDGLLEAVLESHGGPSKWADVKAITVRMSLGGPFWAARGWPNVFADVIVKIEAHRERLSFFPFTAPELTAELMVGPEVITISDREGRVVERRSNPRASFPVFGDATRWDAVQVAYFTSAAVWNYLTAPFVFTMPGVMAREIEPWTEGGETWRRLAVTFPATIANHNPDQVFYYDAALMQRRMDYAPDVTGNPPVAHYTHDPKTFDGFVFPTRRRVLLHDATGVADQSFAPITIDIANVKIERTTGAPEMLSGDARIAEAELRQMVHAGESP